MRPTTGFLVTAREQTVKAPEIANVAGLVVGAPRCSNSGFASVLAGTTGQLG